jgi:hypothetical protein
MNGRGAALSVGSSIGLQQAAPLPSAGRSDTFFIRVYSRAFAVGFESGARRYRSFFETLMVFFLYYILTIGAVEMAPANEKIHINLSITAIPVRRSEKRRVNFMRTKTISDYPLLIGELIRRSELRKERRQRWSAFFKINRPAQKA